VEIAVTHPEQPEHSEGPPYEAIISALAPEGEQALLRIPNHDLIEAVLGTDPIGWRINLTGAAGFEPASTRM